MKYHAMFYFFFLGFCPVFTWANDPLQELTCSEIESFDMKNASILFKPFGPQVQFMNGKACPKEEVSSSCEWEYVITADRTIRPDPMSPVRFIIVNANHLTGSGAWDYLILFTCKEGKLKQILNLSYLYGVKFNLISDKKFVTKSGHWRKTDSPGFPSQEKEETFVWNTQNKSYDLIATKVKDVAK